MDLGIGIGVWTGRPSALSSSVCVSHCGTAVVTLSSRSGGSVLWKVVDTDPADSDTRRSDAAEAKADVPTASQPRVLALAVLCSAHGPTIGVGFGTGNEGTLVVASLHRDGSVVFWSGLDGHPLAVRRRVLPAADSLQSHTSVKVTVAANLRVGIVTGVAPAPTVIDFQHMVAHQLPPATPASSTSRLSTTEPIGGFVSDRGRGEGMDVVQVRKDGSTEAWEWFGMGKVCSFKRFGRVPTPSDDTVLRHIGLSGDNEWLAAVTNDSVVVAPVAGLVGVGDERLTCIPFPAVDTSAVPDWSFLRARGIGVLYRCRHDGGSPSSSLPVVTVWDDQGRACVVDPVAPSAPAVWQTWDGTRGGGGGGGGGCRSDTDPVSVAVATPVRVTSNSCRRQHLVFACGETVQLHNLAVPCRPSSPPTATGSVTDSWPPRLGPQDASSDVCLLGPPHVVSHSPVWDLRSKNTSSKTTTKDNNPGGHTPSPTLPPFQPRLLHLSSDDSAGSSSPKAPGPPSRGGLAGAGAGSGGGGPSVDTNPTMLVPPPQRSSPLGGPPPPQPAAATTTSTAPHGSNHPEGPIIMVFAAVDGSLHAVGLPSHNPTLTIPSPSPSAGRVTTMAFLGRVALGGSDVQPFIAAYLLAAGYEGGDVVVWMVKVSRGTATPLALSSQKVASHRTGCGPVTRLFVSAVHPCVTPSPPTSPSSKSLSPCIRIGAVAGGHNVFVYDVLRVSESAGEPIVHPHAVTAATTVTDGTHVLVIARHTLVGHRSAVQRLVWLPNLRRISVHCEDGSTYVWGWVSSHLERVLDATATTRSRARTHAPRGGSRQAHHRPSATPSPPPWLTCGAVHAVDMPIARLQLQIGAMTAMLRHAVRVCLDPLKPSRTGPASASTTPTLRSEPTSTPTSPMPPLTLTPAVASSAISPSTSTSPSPSPSTPPPPLCLPFTLSSSLAWSLIPYLLPWHSVHDAGQTAVDACASLGFQQPPSPFSFVMGDPHSTCYTVLCPDVSSGRRRWRQSRRLSAVLALALSTTLHSCKKVVSGTVTSGLPASRLPVWAASLKTLHKLCCRDVLKQLADSPLALSPSLAELGKWGAGSRVSRASVGGSVRPLLRNAARRVLSDAIHGLSPQQSAALWYEWSARFMSILPSSSTLASLSSPLPKATLGRLRVSLFVLAVLAHTHPAHATTDMTKRLVDAMLLMVDGGDVTDAAFALGLFAYGFPLWRPQVSATALQSFVRQLLTLAADASSPTGGDALSALLRIGTCAPRELLSFIHEQLQSASLQSATRQGGLVTLARLCERMPESLLPFLELVVESLVAALDPRDASRQQAVKEASAAITSVLRTFPMTAFRKSTKKLAFGGIDGAVVVYDIQSATKHKVLKGEPAFVGSVAFSPSGEWVASYSPVLGVVQGWKLEQGMFSSFMGRGSSSGFKLSLPSTDTAPTEPGGVNRMLLGCSLVWVDEERLRLRREDGEVTTLSRV